MEIKITMVDGKISFEPSAPITFEDCTAALFTTLLGNMESIVEAAPAEHKEEAKASIYDAVNIAASRVLEMFAPEYELRPNLTAQAILEAENRIIMEDRLSEVEPGT